MKTDLVIAGYIIHQDKALLIHHKKLDSWLPVGGHIDENETPDQALLREIKEEVDIDVEILNKSDIPLGGNTKRNLATPFCVNIHSVGDHDHCCLFYVCKAINPEQLKINEELKNFKWFTKDDLNKNHVPVDVRNICLRAFDLYNSFSK
ncbi:nucleoside triphosphate pyrophosphohydrolase [bacterium BMS3Abin15]|nr:nucleoside triphosphate pyrophosphohydrolase [bacterium BMS3Abin15]HDZ85339.1 NUDIX domain-containing protein [Candidatus Moranbacteria bacterium]